MNLLLPANNERRFYNVMRVTGRKVRQYAHAECVRGAGSGPCVALSIVARGVRRGCRRKEGKPRNKAVAPVTHERAPERTCRIINARGVLLVAHKKRTFLTAEMNGARVLQKKKRIRGECASVLQGREEQVLKNYRPLRNSLLSYR